MSILTCKYPGWLDIAEKELGVSEVVGEKDNPRIVEYHKSVDDTETPDEISWCSSFVNWVMKKSNLVGTNSRVARSWLSWGVGLKVPAFGSIVVLIRGNHPWQGHVGFFIGEPDRNTIRIIGGNQGNKVSIANYPKTAVLGYRWPG